MSSFTYIDREHDGRERKLRQLLQRVLPLPAARDHAIVLLHAYEVWPRAHRIEEQPEPTRLPRPRSRRRDPHGMGAVVAIPVEHEARDVRDCARAAEASHAVLHPVWRRSTAARVPAFREYCGHALVRRVGDDCRFPPLHRNMLPHDGEAPRPSTATADA
jgi:hypothetical protein